MLNKRYLYPNSNIKCLIYYPPFKLVYLSRHPLLIVFRTSVMALQSILGSAYHFWVLMYSSRCTAEVSILKEGGYNPSCFFSYTTLTSKRSQSFVFVLLIFCPTQGSYESKEPVKSLTWLGWILYQPELHRRLNSYASGVKTTGLHHQATLKFGKLWVYD